MDSEQDAFALIYWKVQLGKPLRPAEEAQWQAWLQSQRRRLSWEEVEEELLLRAQVERLKRETAAAFDERFGIPATPVVKQNKGLVRRISVWAVAAAVVGGVIAGVEQWLVPDQPDQTQAAILAPLQVDSLPRGTAITLIAPDSIRYTIDTKDRDRTILQTQRIAIRMKGDTLLYTARDHAAADSVQKLYTIVVPVGKQLWVILADKSKVCINSNSALQSPDLFTQAQRTVAMTGDVFFHVQANKQWPFYVHGGGTSVAATGTHFNVRTFEDGAYQEVTLFSGRISIKRQAASRDVESPQMYKVSAGGIELKLSGEEQLADIAGRERGYFNYTQVSMGKLIGIVADWYKLEVADGAAFDIPYEVRFGPLSKLAPVDSVLVAFERQKFGKFVLDGNKLTVTRKK